MKDGEELLMNRCKFAEVLLLVCESDFEIRAEAAQIGEMVYYQELSPILTRFIVPFLARKEADEMPISLHAFRNKYVWLE